MPPKPTWYADIPKIRRTLAALPEMVPLTLDRLAVEKLFGIGPRQSNNLMCKVPGYTKSNRDSVARTALIDMLDELASPGGVAHAAIQRKISTSDLINTIQHKARPKRIPMPPPKPVGAALPAGVSQFAPGKVLIEYTTSEECVSCILALAYSARDDFASFEEGLVYPHPRNGDCTADNDSLHAGPTPPDGAAESKK